MGKTLALFLVSIILVWTYPCLGLDPVSDSNNEGTWYYTNAPSNDNKLKDEGLQQREETGLWIVNDTEKEKRKSLEVPQDTWIKLKIVPDANGNLNLYCRYPTGSVDLLLSDQVKKGHSYKAQHHTELIGDYELWYTLEGNKSNSLFLDVNETSLTIPPSSGGTAYPALTGAFNKTIALDYYNMTNGSGNFVLDQEQPFSVSAGGGVPKVTATMMAAAPRAFNKQIGFSVGGAKDINNFRENIENNYLPLPTDISYEGLYYDYYFDTGQSQECKKLFCPSYSYAISKDPFSKEPQYYLSVGLNSNITNYQRKKLNLVVVLDYSGSMGSSFDQYYYDRFGNLVELMRTEDSGKKKIKIADEAVVTLLNNLKPDDRFGLVIFSDSAFLVDPLTSVSDKDLTNLKKSILNIDAYGSTNMESGMKKATKTLSRYEDANPAEYENRIIFITDAMPNLGETEQDDISHVLKDNAARKIYTTFIGVGVDFNTELVNNITKTQGANYYSVHSSDEFKKRMGEEFDYMVNPLVFDLSLDLKGDGYKIEKVYGSPEADEATGELLKVNTLFPSKAEEGQVKGGVVLVKLKKLSPESSLVLRATYKDRNGTDDSDEAKVNIQEKEPDFNQNAGIHKAVLLSRYADLLRDWTIDERKALEKGEMVVPTVTLECGIVVPILLGEWERQSVPLQVSEPYRKLFGLFGSYFEDESKAIADDTLQQEQVLLEKLSKYRK